MAGPHTHNIPGCNRVLCPFLDRAHEQVQPRCSLPDWEREHGLAAALAPGLHGKQNVIAQFGAWPGSQHNILHESFNQYKLPGLPTYVALPGAHPQAKQVYPAELAGLPQAGVALGHTHAAAWQPLV